MLKKYGLLAHIVTQLISHGDISIIDYECCQEVLPVTLQKNKCLILPLPHTINYLQTKFVQSTVGKMPYMWGDALSCLLGLCMRRRNLSPPSV